MLSLGSTISGTYRSTTKHIFGAWTSNSANTPTASSPPSTPTKEASEDLETAMSEISDTLPLSLSMVEEDEGDHISTAKGIETYLLHHLKQQQENIKQLQFLHHQVQDFQQENGSEIQELTTVSLDLRSVYSQLEVCESVLYTRISEYVCHGCRSVIEGTNVVPIRGDDVSIKHRKILLASVPRNRFTGSLINTTHLAQQQFNSSPSNAHARKSVQMIDNCEGYPHTSTTSSNANTRDVSGTTQYEINSANGYSRNTIQNNLPFNEQPRTRRNIVRPLLMSNSTDYPHAKRLSLSGVPVTPDSLYDYDIDELDDDEDDGDFVVDDSRNVSRRPCSSNVSIGPNGFAPPPPSQVQMTRHMTMKANQKKRKSKMAHMNDSGGMGGPGLGTFGNGSGNNNVNVGASENVMRMNTQSAQLAQAQAQAQTKAHLQSQQQAQQQQLQQHQQLLQQQQQMHAQQQHQLQQHQQQLQQQQQLHAQQHQYPPKAQPRQQQHQHTQQQHQHTQQQQHHQQQQQHLQQRQHQQPHVPLVRGGQGQGGMAPDQGYAGGSADIQLNTHSHNNTPKRVDGRNIAASGGMAGGARVEGYDPYGKLMYGSGCHEPGCTGHGNGKHCDPRGNRTEDYPLTDQERADELRLQDTRAALFAEQQQQQQQYGDHDYELEEDEEEEEDDEDDDFSPACMCPSCIHKPQQYGGDEYMDNESDPEYLDDDYYDEHPPHHCANHTHGHQCNGGIGSNLQPKLNHDFPTARNKLRMKLQQQSLEQARKKEKEAKRQKDAENAFVAPVDDLLQYIEGQASKPQVDGPKKGKAEKRARKKREEDMKRKQHEAIAAEKARLNAKAEQEAKKKEEELQKRVRSEPPQMVPVGSASGKKKKNVKANANVATKGNANGTGAKANASAQAGSAGVYAASGNGVEGKGANGVGSSGGGKNLSTANNSQNQTTAKNAKNVANAKGNAADARGKKGGKDSGSGNATISTTPVVNASASDFLAAAAAAAALKRKKNSSANNSRQQDGGAGSGSAGAGAEDGLRSKMDQLSIDAIFAPAPKNKSGKASSSAGDGNDDDYDHEVEEFKRICAVSMQPPTTRKKMSVDLNLIALAARSRS